MQNSPTETTIRLNDRQYHRRVQHIEDDIAIVLTGKTALDNLILLIRALHRRGILDTIGVDRDGAKAANDDVAAVSRALDLAHELLKEARQADN